MRPLIRVATVWFLGALMGAASVSAIGEETQAESATATAFQEAKVPEIALLETLLAGEIPEGVALAELFPFDLLDEALVAEQANRVQAKLEEISPDDKIARRALRLRLKVLSSGRELRESLVEADVRRLSAQRELEQAEAERLRAEAEAEAADQARREALAAAEAARGAAEKFFATELAKAENVRLEQAKQSQQLAERRVSLRSGEIEGSGEQIRSRIQQALPGAASNRALYERSVREVVAARDGLRATLSTVEAPIEVPRYVLPEPLPDDASLSEVRQKLRVAASELQVQSQALAVEVRRLRHDQAVAEYSRLERLNRSRIDLLEKLADEDRSEILGLGPVGLKQLQRELQQLQLQLEWYRYARANIGFVWASVSEDNDRLTNVVAHLVLFVLLCVAAAWVAARRQRWLDMASAGVYHRVRRPLARRTFLTLLSLIERIFPELLLVAVAFLAPWALGSLATIAEVVIALELFQLFALYRLLVALVYLLISWLSVGSAVLPSRRRQLTLRSLRLVGIYVLATMFILVLSEEALGRGYLYNLVANIWWLGGLPIALVLVRWWQPDIADGYLRFRGTGAMANAVRDSRERWHGFFVTAVAVVVLIVVGIGRLAARFVLGFEQSRKALAFLFRRRLERQADAEGEREKVALDPELLEVLTEGPVGEDGLLTPHFPGEEEFLEQVEKWQEGAASTPTLLVGDTGFGKTTWLLHAQRGLEERGIHVDRLLPPSGLSSGEECIRWLAKELGLPASGGPEVAAEALVNGKKRLVMIDDGHFLLSRTLRGFDAWDALCAVIGAAASNCMFVVCITRFPFDYLVWARNGQITPFRYTMKLKPWTDDEIADLLRTRMAAAGFHVRYDDLVAERVEGVTKQTQMLRTETEYARLIWDYSDGCPRTALRCWAASLEPAGSKTVSVRLFRRPDLEVLKHLSVRERMVLAALVWHQAVTRKLTAEVLRFAPEQCAQTLMMLRDAKIIYENEGVFRLESDWLQPVRRLLRRENLIVD